MEEFSQLVDLMDTLRNENGCPWDREQTRETLKPMLIEEAFEVIEAMESPQELREELGDLLFQIVFHARIAKENGEFDIREFQAGQFVSTTKTEEGLITLPGGISVHQQRIVG